MKALVAEMVGNFSKRLSSYGIQVSLRAPREQCVAQMVALPLRNLLEARVGKVLGYHFVNDVQPLLLVSHDTK